METQPENIIVTKTYAFALKSIRVYKSLISNKEYVLSKQFLKSATSIGANVEEAIGAQSKKDFIAKELLHDCEEILKILTAILKTSKESKIINY